MFDFAPRINTLVQKIIKPTSVLMHEKLGLSPNQLTVISFIIGLIAAGFVFAGYPGVGIFLLLLSLIFDALDGAVARQYDLATRQGEILDIVTDRINEALFYFALVYVGLVDLSLVLLTIVAILLMTSLMSRSKFDPGLKRIMLIPGYLLNNFTLALTVTFFASLIGFMISLVILDYRSQQEIDKASTL